MVPDINNQPEHLAAIGALAMQNPTLKVEILPYHKMGTNKAERIGKKPCVFKEADKQRIERWHNELINAGCPNNNLTIHSF